MKTICTKATSKSHAGMNLVTARDTKTKSLYEELGGTYTLGEDGMYYPDLEIPKDEEPRYGKYGRMYLNYIKEHRPWLYTELLFDGKLVSYLNSIDDEAHRRMELLTRQMQE